MAFAKALAKGVGLEMEKGESPEEQAGRSPKPTDVTLPPPNDTFKEPEKPSDAQTPKVVAAGDSGKWIIDIRLTRS